MSWVEREGKKSTLKFAERTASGWSAPSVVISSERLMVNAADVPSVRAMPDGSFAAHWLEESGPDPEAYNLRVAFSTDGKTWSAAVAPNRDKTVSQHGFASLFPAPNGGLGLSGSTAAQRMATKATCSCVPRCLTRITSR